MHLLGDGQRGRHLKILRPETWASMAAGAGQQASVGVSTPCALSVATKEKSDFHNETII